MQDILEFIDDLLGGVELFALSLTVGAVMWTLLVLRLGKDLPRGGEAAVGWAARLLLVGAASLCLVQLLGLGIKAWVLAASLDRSPFPAFFHTIQFSAGLTRAVIAAAIAAGAVWVARAPMARWRWRAVAAAALLLLVSGAWLAHGESRIENRALLMTLTTVHQFAAATWVGCIAQLLVLWRVKRRKPEIAAAWPILLSRFSPLGIAVVIVLVATGVSLADYYVNTWRGLLGTSYGAVVMTKLVLLAATLGFAAHNFGATWRWTQGGDGSAVMTRVPYVIEAEMILLAALLFAASALTSQPPAVDTGAATATYAEVVHVFAPKMPRVISPAHDAVLADRRGPLTVSAQEASPRTGWSEFNHNVSGLFLVAMALAALVGHIGGARWARYWPIGFIGLGVFVLLRSDPDTWPLGPEPFWTSIKGIEVLQHRLAVVLTFTLGAIEWRARAPRAAGTRLSYAFPFLCVSGGILLLTHSHTDFVIKSEYLIQISHIAMAALAILMGCGRWLELRLAPPAGHLAGSAAIVAMLLIGLILTFYWEPVG